MNKPEAQPVPRPPRSFQPSGVWNLFSPYVNHPYSAFQRFQSCTCATKSIIYRIHPINSNKHHVIESNSTHTCIADLFKPSLECSVASRTSLKHQTCVGFDDSPTDSIWRNSHEDHEYSCRPNEDDKGQQNFLFIQVIHKPCCSCIGRMIQ